MPELPQRQRAEQRLKQEILRVFAAYAGAEEVDFEKLASDIEEAVAEDLERTRRRAIITLLLIIMMDSASRMIRGLYEDARESARQQASTLGRSIAETSREWLSQARSREEYQDILARRVLSVDRAESIAITETTIAASGGEEIVEDEAKAQGIRLDVIWYTKEDERVCPICGSLHNTTESVWSRVGRPPAHPRCRCWLVYRKSPSVVSESVDPCGAGSPGGKGFEKGNTCSKSAKKLQQWALDKFKDEEKAANFLQWFGSSKVVGEDNLPLVVYRGSTGPYQEVSPVTGVPSFTQHSQIASVYAAQPTYWTANYAEKSNVTAAYISMQSPLKISSVGVSLGKMMGKAFGRSDEVAIESLVIVDELIYRRVYNRGPEFKMQLKGIDGEWRTWRDLREWVQDATRAGDVEKAFQLLDNVKVDAFAVADTRIFVNAAKKAGYDGVIHKDTFEGGAPLVKKLTGREADAGALTARKEHWTYRPFYPHQVKSAIANKGTFDKSKGMLESDQCGAGSPGGRGFAKGNTCATNSGSSSSDATKRWAIKKWGDEKIASNFAAWFGDSKLVDGNGDPAVVYHGTNKNFDAFDPGLIGANTGNLGHHGKGVYLSLDKREAQTYGSIIISAYAKIENPFIPSEENFDRLKKAGADWIDDKSRVAIDKETLIAAIRKKDPSAADLASMVSDHGHEKGFEMFMDKYPNGLRDISLDVNSVADLAEKTRLPSIDDDYRPTLDDWVFSEIDQMGLDGVKYVEMYKYAPKMHWVTDLGNRSEEVTALLKTMGHDGVISGTEVVVFDPRAIKSADDNSGEFDATSPSFRESDSCGAGSPGGRGFEKGNTCASNDSSESGRVPKSSGKVIAWAEKKFADKKKAKNFVDWFGSSKVVNDSGEPTVLYHGTSADFSEFSHDFSGSSTGAKNGSLGFFFTDSPSVASSFGDRVMPVYMRMENPLEIGFDLMKTSGSHVSDESVDGYKPVKNAILKVSGKKSWEEVDSQDIQEWKSKIIGLGFDGVIINTAVDSVELQRYGETDGRGKYRMKPHKMHIVFAANQIKSATANTGAFSNSSGDIRESDECGAGSPGGKGFMPGNTCAKGDASPVLAWAEKKFGSAEEAKNFAEWFADGAVVNSDGTPRVVYHGTTAPEEFSEFETLSDAYSTLDEMVGFHVATDPKLAETFVKKLDGSLKPNARILPLYTAIQNPRKAPQKVLEGGVLEHDAYAINRDIRSAVFPKDKDLFLGWIQKSRNVTPSQAVDIWDRLQSGESIGRDEFNGVVSIDLKSKTWEGEHPVSAFVGSYDSALLMLSKEQKRSVVEAYKDEMRKQGYDGIVYTNTAPMETGPGIDQLCYIAFDKPQLKSATGNSGAWKRSSNDIRESDECGAGSAGGKGFEKGNTCASSSGGESFSGDLVSPAQSTTAWDNLRKAVADKKTFDNDIVRQFASDMGLNQTLDQSRKMIVAEDDIMKAAEKEEGSPEYPAWAIVASVFSDKLMSSKPQGLAKFVFKAYYDLVRMDSKSRAEKTIERAGDANVLVFASQKSPNKRMVVHPSTRTKEKGKWQLSFMDRLRPEDDKRVPIGHSTYDSRDEAILSAVDASSDLGSAEGSWDYEIIWTDKDASPMPTLESRSIKESDECGAGSPGGKGFEPGNTCAKRSADIALQAETPSQWYSRLTDAQKQMVLAWGSKSADVRRIQTGSSPDRNLSSGKSYAQEWSMLLDSAPKRAGTVYRGLSMVPDEVVMTWMNSKAIEIATDQSASFDRLTAEKFRGSGLSSRGAEVLWQVNQTSGAYVGDTTGVYYGDDPQTGFVNEDELILRKGSRLRVDSMEFMTPRGPVTGAMARDAVQRKADEKVADAERKLMLANDQVRSGIDNAVVDSVMRRRRIEVASREQDLRNAVADAKSVTVPSDFLPHHEFSGFYLMKMSEVGDE
ncbi:MAG: phage minor head protein [Bacteroidota bacterium]